MLYDAINYDKFGRALQFLPSLHLSTPEIGGCPLRASQASSASGARYLTVKMALPKNI